MTRTGKITRILFVTIIAVSAAAWTVGIGELRRIETDRKMAEAVVAGDVGRARAMLDAGADPSAVFDYETPRVNAWRGLLRVVSRAARRPPGSRHMTPLLEIAIQNERDNVFALLIERHADLESRDSLGRTPLALAAEAAKLRFVERLLKLGARVDARDSFGRSPLVCALQKNNADIADLLIQSNATIDPLGATLLNDTKALRKALKAGLPPVGVTSEGKTPLALACERGNVESVKLLMPFHPNVNTRDLDGCTPLMYADGARWSGIAEMLATAGAGLSPTDATVIDRPDLLASTLRPGLDVDRPDDVGRTALAIACAYGDAEMARALIRAGADPNREDARGRTPIMWAAGAGSVKIVQALAAAKANVNARDKDGRTAFIWAAFSPSPDHLGLFKELAALGADPNAADTNGFTAARREAIRQGRAWRYLTRKGEFARSVANAG